MNTSNTDATRTPRANHVSQPQEATTTGLGDELQNTEERQGIIGRVFIERYTTKEEYPVRYSHQEGITLRKGKALLSTLTNTKVLAARNVVRLDIANNWRR